MSEYGVFESVAGSDSEKKIASKATQRKLDAAIYDCRNQFGALLFASRDIQEFRDNVALVKDAALKTVEPHLFPVTSVMRRIIGKGGALEKEFKQLQASDYTDRTFGPGFEAPQHHPRAEDMGFSREDIERDKARQHEPAPAPGSRIYPHEEEGGYNMSASRRIAGPQFGDAFEPQNQQPYQPGQPSAAAQQAGQPLSPADHVRNTAEKAKAWLMAQPTGPGSGMVARRADKTGPAMDLDQTFAPKKDKDLVPKANWEGYRNSVDQGAPEKISDCFGETELQERKARLALQLYSDWCECNGLRKASIANLDKYAVNLGDATYFRIADVLLQADGMAGPQAVGGSGAAPAAAGTGVAPQMGMGMGGMAAGATPDGGPPASGDGGAAGGGGYDGGGGYTARRRHAADEEDPEQDNLEHERDRRQDRQDSGQHYAHGRTAAPDYLQKADEALTNLLNQKAEEFQEGIGALQQALQTVQYAESVQQQQNPLNVQPPAGTVNVLPQSQDPGQPPAGGGGVLDQGALPAPGGGGAAPDPAAGGAGLAGMPAPGGAAPPDPTQQVQARRRKRAAHPAVDEYHNWAHQNGLDPEDALEHYDRNVRPLSNDEYTAIVDSITPGGHDGWEPGHGPHNARRRTACYPGCEENEAHAAKFHKDKEKESRRQSSDRAGKQRRPFDRRKADVLKAWEAEHNGSDPSATWRGDAGDYTTFAEGHGYQVKPDGSFGPAVNRLQQEQGTQQSTLGMPHAMQPAALPAAPPTTARRRKQGNDPGPLPDDLQEHSLFQQWLAERPLFHEWLDEHQNIGPGRVTEGSRKQSWQGWGTERQTPGNHKVAGWEWDNHLNGYISTTADRFACKCGQSIPAPSYSQCRCGRLWNSYVIGSGGDNRQGSLEKIICRQVPTRDGVIVARTADQFGHGGSDPREPIRQRDRSRRNQGEQMMIPGLDADNFPPVKGYQDPEQDSFDPREFGASIHNLEDPGECHEEDGKDDGRPKGKTNLADDWAFRDPNQRFLPGHH